MEETDTALSDDRAEKKGEKENMGNNAQKKPKKFVKNLRICGRKNKKIACAILWNHV